MAETLNTRRKMLLAILAFMVRNRVPQAPAAPPASPLQRPVAPPQRRGAMTASERRRCCLSCFNGTAAASWRHVRAAAPARAHSSRCRRMPLFPRLQLLFSFAAIGDQYIGWATMTAILAILIVIDFMFLDDSSFVFEPDVKVRRAARGGGLQPRRRGKGACASIEHGLPFRVPLPRGCAELATEDNTNVLSGDERR